MLPALLPRAFEQIRYGHLAVLPDMASLTPEKVASLVKITQAAKDADTGKSTDGEPVNVLHVALMKVSRRDGDGDGGGRMGGGYSCSASLSFVRRFAPSRRGNRAFLR